MILKKLWIQNLLSFELPFQQAQEHYILIRNDEDQTTLVKLCKISKRDYTSQLSSPCFSALWGLFSSYFPYNPSKVYQKNFFQKYKIRAKIWKINIKKRVTYSSVLFKKRLLTWHTLVLFTKTKTKTKTITITIKKKSQNGAKCTIRWYSLFLYKLS